MRPIRARAAERHLHRLMRRVGVTDDVAPDVESWREFLTASQSLIGDLDQDRYLVERSLDISSAEMARLTARLKAQAGQIADEREELRQMNSMLEATLESTADGILVVARDGRVTGYNTRFTEMWGVPPERIAPDVDDAANVVADRVDPSGPNWTTLVGVRTEPGEASHDTVTFADGRVVERNSLPQHIGGEIVGRVWSFRDITEQRSLQEELAHQAFHDGLTGLANRALFADHVHEAIRRRGRTGGHVAVCVADLDGFKTVNDSLGHATGDALLVEVADRLRSALRDVDTVARIGGDEFAVVVEGLETPEEVARLGRRIMQATADPIWVDERDVSVGISIGIALVTSPDDSADTLLSNADTAMYRAKRDGKNCYRIFETWMEVKATERLELEQALRRDVRAGAIEVHYQPVVDAVGGRVVCFEALARWSPDGHTTVPPDVFIPIAEESGMIVELGRSVLFEACRQARRWQAVSPGDQPTVAVNASRRQLVDPRFPADVDAALAESGLAPGRLVIEVTESVIASDTGAIAATLNDLRRRGIAVAMDDFGTGQSSFAALADLPIDTIKIDKRFVDNVATPGAGYGLVEAIARLARTLDLTTTAEGVESADQIDALRSLGCDHLQGYHFSRPLTADDSVRYLADAVAVAGAVAAAGEPVST